MEKDFTNWQPQKPQINDRKQRPFFNEREVWWCSLGVNIGSEEDGKGEKFGRPVLIYRKFNNSICWAIPITTVRKDNPFYIPIVLNDKIERFAKIQQLKLIDVRRLYQRMGMTNLNSFNSIVFTISQLAGFDWQYKKSEATLVGAAPRPKPL